MRWDPSESKVELVDLLIDKETPLSFNDTSFAWSAEILDSLNSRPDQESETYLEFEGYIGHFKGHEFGQYFCLKGTLNCRYYTTCVNTLEEMIEELSVDIISCFISDHYTDDQIYRDEIEIYTRGEVWDLYFYENDSINLKDVFTQLIDLNKNPYPKKNDFKNPQ